MEGLERLLRRPAIHVESGSARARRSEDAGASALDAKTQALVSLGAVDAAPQLALGLGSVLEETER